MCVCVCAAAPIGSAAVTGIVTADSDNPAAVMIANSPLFIGKHPFKTEFIRLRRSNNIRPAQLCV